MDSIHLKGFIEVLLNDVSSVTSSKDEYALVNIGEISYIKRQGNGAIIFMARTQTEIHTLASYEAVIKLIEEAQKL